MEREPQRRIVGSLGLILVIGLTFVGAIFRASHTTALAYAPPTDATDSNYVATSNVASWQGWGCDQANWSTSVGQTNIVVILDFGQPYIDPAGSGLQGALIFDASNTFVPWDNSGEGVRQWLLGSPGTGTATPPERRS